MILSVFLTAYFWLFLGYMLGVFAWITGGTVMDDRRPYSDFALIKDWLESVLRRGYEGGYLWLGHEPTGRFMMFRKYIRGKGDYGLEIQTLTSDWSESTLRETQELAEDAGLPHRLGASKKETESRTYLAIDCGRNTVAAYDVGASIWTGIFGLTLETPYKAVAGGLSEVGEHIDGPDHPPPLEDIPPRKRLREMDARLRKLGRPSIATMLFAVTLAPVLMISGLGFPIAMLMSRGQAPDWSFQFGPVGLGGSTAGLAFLVLLILSVWGIRRIKLGKARKLEMGRWERPAKWLTRTIAVGLPFAVVLAWSGF